jgi:hypothetical protein
MISKFISLARSLAAASLVLALAVTAIGAENIPYADAFELYDEGESIIGQNGWMGPTNDPEVATVTADIYTYDKPGGRPLADSPHSKYMVLQAGSSEVSNNFNVAAENTYIDMMVKLEQAPEGWTPPATNDIQAALFVNTNGDLVVYHSIWLDPPDGLTFSNSLTVCDAAYLPALGTGEWARLEIAMDYETLADNNLALFQLTVDKQPVTNKEAVVDITVHPAQMTGTWFFCANADKTHNPYLSTVGLSGTGSFDDFVVTNGPPGSSETFYDIQVLVSPSDGRGGTGSPLGNFSVTSGASQVIDFFPTNYWFINETTDNTTSLGNTNKVVLTDIQESHTVICDFDPELVTNNTPKWWLAARGFTPDDAGALDDADLDGDPNWKERLASTDANSSNSVFEIVESGQMGGTNYVRWMAYDIDPDLPPFQVWRATDLASTNDPWSFRANVTRQDGTNTWMENGQGITNNPWFYRLRATD